LTTHAIVSPVVHPHRSKASRHLACRAHATSVLLYRPKQRDLITRRVKSTSGLDTLLSGTRFQVNQPRSQLSDSSGSLVRAFNKLRADPRLNSDVIANDSYNSTISKRTWCLDYF
jgi:hypothetical protein